MVESIKELKKICQEPRSDIDDWYEKNMARRFSIYFTKIFLSLGLTGNQVTLITIIFGIFGTLLFIFNNYWYSLVGAIILEVHFILDYVDGEVARYRKKTSIKGMFLEAMGHDVVYPLIFITLAFGAYRATSDYTFFIYGFLASLSMSLFQLKHNTKELILYQHGTNPEKLQKQRGKLKGGFKFFGWMFKHYGIVDMVLLGAIIGVLPFVLMFYGIFMPIIWTVSLYKLMRGDELEV